MFGQLSRLSDNLVRSLVAAGAAGGIAAGFNAPITGVFFALEIIVGELGVSAFGVVTLASVVSSVFTQGDRDHNLHSTYLNMHLIQHGNYPSIWGLVYWPGLAQHSISIYIISHEIPLKNGEFHDG
ncbi:MAG: hypothetical protein DWB56_11795 [Candidatus Jettenia sp.]|nr:MAG: hypothetical protein EDM77_13670 [Candidatus Jettenia sp. AMX1]MBC6929619.1 hypothetical protein [Candidatus Jettenia sp.]GIL20165.1 MAG: hypothetical protein BroJett041_12790 [Candidatus Jettenia caeni]MCE7879739.1 hypothetical protein [Candidatus Jettenia sp. AMX1]MCQ3927780.1 hypothetical protein [Candidatus Jettenia sp.]